MLLIRPPITGDAQLDSWTDRITRTLNAGGLPGGGGSGGGGAGGGSQGPAGNDGADGVDGNTSLYLYTRTNSLTTVPTPPTSVTYDLDATPVSITATGGSHTWEHTPTELTSTDRYLWVTFRYVANRSGTITNANSWDTPVLLGLPGDDAIFVRIDNYRLPATGTASSITTAYDAGTFDFSTLRASQSGLQFRNDTGEDKVLVATVHKGGSDATDTEHENYSYVWSKNGLAFTPDDSSQSLTRRFLVINANDVADGGEDVFQCTVTESQEIINGICSHRGNHGYRRT